MADDWVHMIINKLHAHVQISEQILLFFLEEEVYY